MNSKEPEMRALTKGQLQEKDDLHEALVRARDRLNAAVLAGEEDVEEAREELEQAYAAVEDWLVGVREEQEYYYNSRGEKWREDDRGAEYYEWMEAYDSAQLDDLFIEPGKPVELDVSVLEDLPDRPD
jgi:hypothetical protein